MILPLLLVACCAVGGCHSTPHQTCNHQVSMQLADRSGYALGPVACPGETSIPPGVILEDGLTEDEAVTLALWNNAAYRELLSQLGIAQAQVFDAGLLEDPQLIILFPLGPKQFEFTAFQFVDFLWLRPVRLRAAELGYSRVAEQLVQNGLDVIRDVRVAHANLLLAQEAARLADEAAGIRDEIAVLAQKQLEAGDISELEATDSQVQALSARADAERLAFDADVARQQLCALVGLVALGCEMTAVESPVPPLPVADEAGLVAEAFAFRPDLRAAEIAVAEAQARAQFERKNTLLFEMGYDANSFGTQGRFESGPALRARLPLFNRNRGRIAIAQAQLDQANSRYVTLRDQVALDVRTALTTARQASENLRAVQEEILPKIKSADVLARKNYVGGGTSYFLVLQTTSQYLDARTRELQSLAALRRAIAELDRAVGHGLSMVVDAGVPPAPAEVGEAGNAADSFNQAWSTHQDDSLPEVTAPVSNVQNANVETDVQGDDSASPVLSSADPTLGEFVKTTGDEHVETNSETWLPPRVSIERMH